MTGSKGDKRVRKGDLKGHAMPKEDTQFKKGDPDGRAAAAAHKARGVPKRNKAQIAADASFAALLNRQPKLPKNFEAPSHLEIQNLALATIPATLHFASSIIEDEKAPLADKFSAIGILLKLAGPSGAEQEEINGLKRILKSLKDEHAKVVTELQAENEKLKTEIEDLKTPRAVSNAA